MTAFEANNAAFTGFASRFAAEEMTSDDDFTNATVSEFLNLHNGLFTVNMSNENETELELTPQVFEKDTIFTFEGSAFCIPLVFPFGTVNFIIGSN